MIFFSLFFLGVFSIFPPAIPPEIESRTPLERFSIESDYGAERCVSRDCTCRVSLSRIPLESISKSYSATGRVYFEESSAVISIGQAKEIVQYMSENPGQKYFTVTGYTDGCGGNNYNYGLSLRRARAVSDFIKSKRQGSIVTVKAVAELSNGHSPMARRVDITSQATSRSYPDYPEIIADVYLIDASGSMGKSYKGWLSAISRSRPLSSKVFISYTGQCYNGQDALSLSASGATEIWYSYWYILDSMSRGQTLAIISDFDSRVPLTNSERVRLESKVKKRGVKVIAVTP